MLQPTQQRRGRPRDPVKDEFILAATQSLLAVRGFHSLRVDDVARAAGVPKSTIYRRWSSLRSLAVDAYASGVNQIEFPETPDAWADFISAVDLVQHELETNPLARSLAVAGVALADESELYERFLLRFVEPAAEWMRALVDRGTKAGQMKPTIGIEEIVTTVIGMLCFYLSCRRTIPPRDSTLALARELMKPTT